VKIVGLEINLGGTELTGVYRFRATCLEFLLICAIVIGSQVLDVAKRAEVFKF
jgi:hypothetical protein